MFYRAQPVYPSGKEWEMNSFAAFSAKTGSLKGAVMYITAFSFYRLQINGKFVSFGPARTVHGYARVDEIALDEYDSGADNDILIIVAGYACRSFATMLQPSFLWAEIRRGEEPICWTGRDFAGYLPSCKLKQTLRYSIQRHFSEYWDFRRGVDILHEDERAELSVMQNPPQLLPRCAPYALYEDISRTVATAVGHLHYDPEIECHPNLLDEWSSERWGMYPLKEIPHNPYGWLQQQAQTATAVDCSMPLTLHENEYALVDFGQVEAGFLTFSMSAEQESDVAIAFSEDSTTSTQMLFRPMRGMYNGLGYALAAGDSVQAATFEPYTARYVMVAVRSGEVTLRQVGIKTFVRDVSSVTIPMIEDDQLRAIYRGALRTFAHNAVDIYMDCPSRERAGWLCDSYFTAKVEFELFGNTQIEDAFLENYRLYRDVNGELPDGMLSMSCPSDVSDQMTYIPQWTMWYILEVAEYLLQRKPEADRQAFLPGIQKLLAFYRQYENEDGLLEKLPSWNFVEWSRANDWTQDVNYPTNFLYAETLECVYRIYGDEECLRRSREVREKALEQSFNGQVFLDHAVRNEQNQLVLQSDCSEVCQYYAVLFGGFRLDDEKYAQLKHLILNVFSADEGSVLPGMEPINAFIGVYLRLLVLLRLEAYPQALRDVRAFFGAMEEKTGTLWEHRDGAGSLDHGFASYALIVIKQALGL